MKKFLLIVVFFNLFSVIWAQTPKENRDKFDWYYTPWLDSINQNNLDSQTFQIFNQGKTGWMDVNYGILCAPIFTKTLPPQRFSAEYYNDIWLTWGSFGNKWGIYQRRNEYYLDTGLIIACEFDSIIVAKRTKDELHLKAWKGKKAKLYNVLNNAWIDANNKINPIIYEPPLIKEEPQEGVDIPDFNTVAGPIENYQTTNGYMEKDVGAINSPYPPGFESQQTSNEPKSKLKNRHKYIKSITDSNTLKYGLYSGDADSFIIKPLYKRIERDDANNYFCYLFNTNNHFIVLDSNGIPLTHILTEIDMHRVPQFNIVKGLSGMEFIYNKQMRLLWPDSFLRVNNGPTVPFANVTKKDFSMQLFDYNKLVLLPEKFDAIFLGSNLPLLIAEQKGYLIIRNYDENKTIKVKKARFTYYCIASTLVIRKKNKNYLMNLRSGEVAKKGWDSIQTTAIPYIEGDISVKKQNRLKDIFIVYEKGKMGLIDHNKNLLLKPEYDKSISANRKFPGLLTFVTGNKYTLYSAISNLVLAKDIDSFRYINYSVNIYGSSYNGHYYNQKNGDKYLLAFHSNNKWGILYNSEAIEIPPIYDSIVSINSRLFFVKSLKYHLLNSNFNYLQDVGYDSVEKIENKYMLLKKGHLYFFMNTSNQLIPETGTPWLSKIQFPYSQIIYLYKKDNLFGLIRTAYYETPALLEDVRYGKNQLLWAKINGKWGIIEQ